MVGYWASTPKTFSQESGPRVSSNSTTWTSKAAARVRTTSIVWGWHHLEIKNRLPVFAFLSAKAMASAAAVASSSSDALAISMPVNSHTMV